MPLSPGIGMQRQADFFEFKTSLIYIQSEFQDKPRKEKHCLSRNKYTNK